MDYLENLNPSQRQAVTHIEGPMLVLAGPGSGKTRVVTSRIAHLLEQGIPDQHILALTFTNKAASEMSRRVAQLCPGRWVAMSTFHRFCSRLLRRHAGLVGLSESFRIYDTQDSRKAIAAVIEDADIELYRVTPAQIARTISNAKNELALPETFELMASPSSPMEQLAAEIYPLYQKRLLQSNAVDFDDLLMHVAILLRENQAFRQSLDAYHQFILVDEYQDTNLAQYTIARALSIDYPNLAVTGDPDQSIYGWRGADITNILEFEKDYPNVRVVRLEQNYRSTANILSVADQLISNNTKRKEKSLYTDNADGQPVRLMRYSNGQEEADDIARQISDLVQQGSRQPRDVAVLCRTNALTRALEHALHAHQVPYQIVNGLEFYQRKEIKDVMAYLHLLNNPCDDVAFSRIINIPARGLGKKSLGLLRDHALRHAVPLMTACREAQDISGLQTRARKSFAQFVTTMDGLADVADKPIEAMVGRVLMDSGYRDALTHSNSEDDDRRLANIEELVTAARLFDESPEGDNSLDAFLERASLVNETDAWDEDDNRVTLMTLHAAKGLEFPVVYIVAVESGVLPHERAREDPMQREEERRLFFVGITRAKEHLQISLTQYRAYRGRSGTRVPSEFLVELPRAHMDCYGLGPTTGYGSVTAQPQAYPSRPSAAEGFDDSIDIPPTDAMTDEMADEWSQAEWDQAQHEEPVFDVSDPEATAHATASDPIPSDAGTPSAPVVSAADLLRDDQDDVESSHPDRGAYDDFELGMLVSHPEYGPGRIIALSGRAEKRQATIQFLRPPSRREFILHYSDLQPMGKRNSRR